MPGDLMNSIFGDIKEKTKNHRCLSNDDLSPKVINEETKNGKSTGDIGLSHNDISNKDLGCDVLSNKKLSCNSLSDKKLNNELMSDEVESDINLTLLNEAIESASNRRKMIGVWDPLIAAAMYYLKSTIPRFSISDTSKAWIEAGLEKDYPDLTKTLKNRMKK